MLRSIEPSVTSAAQKERVSRVLDGDAMTTMLQHLPENETATLKTIFDNLLIPALENESSFSQDDRKCLENITTKDQLIEALKNVLSLSSEHTLALEKMIDFHSAKARIASLKAEIAEGKAKSEPLLKEIQEVSDLHATYPSGSPESDELQAQVDKLFDRLDAIYPHFPESMMTSLDRLEKLAEQSLSAHQCSSFDLHSFLPLDKKNGYMTLEQLDTRFMTASVIRGMAKSVHILDITEGMQQLIQLGSKPIKPFQLTGVMKSEIEKLLSDLAPDDIPLFIQKLESMETLASSYFPEDKKEFDLRPGIYLKGTPGIGKTTLLRNLAKLTGLDIIDIKADELTVEELTKKLVECPSKNPMFVMDELGELMSDKTRFLSSVARFVIDVDAPDRVGSYKGHIQFDLKDAMERIADWSTGNEDIADDKIKSRKTTCELPGPSETVKGDVATSSYRNKLKPTGRKLIANDRREVMFELFKQDLPRIIEKTSDMRVIKELAANYEVHQMRFFEANRSVSFEKKATLWPSHFKANVLPKLDQVAQGKGVKRSSKNSQLGMMMDYVGRYKSGATSSKSSLFNSQAMRSTSNAFNEPSSMSYSGDLSGRSYAGGVQFADLFASKSSLPTSHTGPTRMTTMARMTTTAADEQNWGGLYSGGQAKTDLLSDIDEEGDNFDLSNTKP